MAVPPMQRLLRPPRLPDDLSGLRLAPARQRAADHRAVPIVPSGLDQDPARVRIAGFRQRTPPVGLAGGVLAGDQPQVGHEFPGPAEALSPRSRPGAPSPTACRRRESSAATRRGPDTAP